MAIDLEAEIRRLPEARRRKLIASFMQDDDVATELLTQKELAKVLRVSQETLIRHLKAGPAKGARVNRDVRTIKTVTVGARKRWPRSAVMEFLTA